MFRFANAWVFYLLPVAIAFVFFAFAYWKSQEKRLQKAFGEKLYPLLTSSLARKRRKIKILLEALVIVGFILSYARPQMGQSEQSMKSEGIELMIAVDVSRSMMAEDVKPSRMDFAKRELTSLLDRMGGHKVGLIVFAGSSVVLSPLTADYSALKMYIDSMDTNSVSTQGTFFEKAITDAKEAFENGGADDDEKTHVTRALLIVSDGEDNEPGALKAAKEIREKDGIRTFTMGVGTDAGGSIPERDSFGYLKGYKKQNGQIVVTRAQMKLLKDLAEAGGGGFYRLAIGGDHIAAFLRDINKLEKSAFDSKLFLNYNEHFQKFLFLTLLLALLELAFGERRGIGRIWKGRFEVKES